MCEKCNNDLIPEQIFQSAYEATYSGYAVHYRNSRRVMYLLHDQHQSLTLDQVGCFKLHGCAISSEISHLTTNKFVDFKDQLSKVILDLLKFYKLRKTNSMNALPVSNAHQMFHSGHLYEPDISQFSRFAKLFYKIFGCVITSSSDYHARDFPHQVTLTHIWI